MADQTDHQELTPIRDDSVAMSLVERQTWLSFMGVAQGFIPLLDAHLKREFGLSYIEHGVLAVLGEQSAAPMKVSALATRMETSLSRMSHVVRRLETDGLVELATSSDDRRATVATLTRAGADLIASAAPSVEAEVQRLLLAPLSAEQRDRLREMSLRLLESWTAVDGSTPLTSARVSLTQKFM